jgi:diguanylate cyclase (GGDEF)-like protein
MRNSHSGLDAWRYVTDSESGRKTVESFLPLILSAFGAAGVLPFIVLRLMQGEWLAAIVDAVIVVGFVGLGIFVYRTRRVRIAGIGISFICIAGVISTVYISGPHQVYWAYPVLVAIFYLVRPLEAITFTLVTVAALIPSLLGDTDSHSTLTILVTIVVMSSFALAFSLVTNRQREKLIQLATKDPLTGAGNRRHLDNKLNEIVNDYQRTATSAAMLLLDLDHLKKVNDSHGHVVGDQILKRITEIINIRIRVTDNLYRIGGDEFVVILEGQTIDHAAHLAEQLRTLVEANELIADQPVTVSVGIAELKANESAEEWLHRADKALYGAKRDGRNTTKHAE